MAFTDIFKKSFLAEVGSVSITSALITLAVALGLALIIFLVYRYAFSGVVYSRNFNISLVVVCLVTTVIVVAISTNIVLSLGMVGALSIVRFRTAVKEPIDVAYMYWAITTGIVCGARMYIFAAIATALVASVFLLMRLINTKNQRHILIINYSKDAMIHIDKVLAGTRHVVKSRTITNNDTELVAEVKVSSKNMAFLNNLKRIESVTNVSLVSYKGD